MKIKKYALGAVFTPLEWNVGLSGQESPSAQASPSGRSAKSDEGFNFTKELFSIMNKSGLYSDRAMIAAEAGSLIDSLNDPYIPESVKLKKMMQLQLHANDVTNNYALWTAANEKISKEDLGSDLAMTSRGSFYVMDGETNKITSKSLNEIKEDSDRYSMLTWNELLNFRDRDLNLAFDRSHIQDAASAIGMKEVMSQVSEVIGKIGTMTNKGYTAKIQNTVQRGLEHLFAPVSTAEGVVLASNDGLYEFKSVDSNAQQSIDAAISFVYSHLTDGAKNVLRANAYKMGFKDTKDLLALSIKEHINSTKELDYLDPDKGKNSGSKSGSGGGSEQLTQDSWAHTLFKGHGLPVVSSITLGDNLRMSMPGRIISNILTKDNNQLGVSRLSQSYRNLQEQGLVDIAGKVYFGDVPLNSPSLEGFDIIVDNTEGGYVINMPVLDNGEINWRLYQVMEEIQSAIVKDNIINPSEQAKIWADNGFDYDPELKTGKPKGNIKTKQFIVQRGYTSTASDVVDSSMLKDSEFIKEAEDGILEQLGKRYNMSPLEEKDKIDLEHGMFGKNFKGLIFIPMNSNENDVLVSSKLAYTPKVNTNDIKSMQDAAIHSGGYDPGIREFKAIENTTIDDL